MTIKIREAEREDVQMILEIINYEILNSTSIYDEKERSYNQQLEWFEQKQKHKMPVLVAEIERKVLGFGSYGVFRPWEGYKYCLEHSVYIEHNYRGKGVGKELLKNLIELAKKDGYHTMIGGIDASNTSSIAFHEKFGFEEVGTIKEAGFKFNTWHDLKFLQLFLNE